MILERILAAKRETIAQRKRRVAPDKLFERAAAASAPRGLAAALSKGGVVRLVAEVKRKSPSKGALRERFDPATLAAAYAAAGADAVSVVTDEPFFGGRLSHLQAVRDAVALPVLCKDFIVDEYQVAEARAAGADGVLLIAAALTDDELSALLAATFRWGMDALVEVHTEGELERALAVGARLVGINNRDLHTFATTLDVTLRLAPRVPADVTLVSESGIQSRADVEQLAAAGVDAVLVGERLVTSHDPGAAARDLTGVPVTKKSRRREESA